MNGKASFKQGHGKLDRKRAAAPYEVHRIAPSLVRSLNVVRQPVTRSQTRQNVSRAGSEAMDIDMPPLQQAASEPVHVDQPRPEAVDDGRFANLEARITEIENAMTRSKDVYERMVAILETMTIKDKHVIANATTSRVTTHEPDSREQVTSGPPAVQPSRPALVGEREPDREASTDVVRRRPNDRQSLKEHLRSGSFRPEELILLLDVNGDDESDLELDDGSPSRVDIMLQDPTADNRQSRREAFCSYFTEKRFKTAWSEYLALLADLRPSHADLVVKEAEAYAKWLLNMNSGSYWSDLMGVHYDIHEKQDLLQRTPGMWTVSNKILQGLGKGELRIRQRMPRNRKPATSSTLS